MLNFWIKAFFKKAVLAAAERTLFHYQQVINSQNSLPKRELSVSRESMSSEVSDKFIVG